MLSITTNVPATEPAKLKTYSKRCNAQRAAIATLGPEAREGFEFISSQLADGTWGWRPTDEVPPMTAAQAKANGVTYHPPASPPATAAVDDGLDIPANLRRPNMLEQQTRVAALVAADNDREVRMPRDSRVVANPKPKSRSKADRLPVPPPKGARKHKLDTKATKPAKERTTRTPRGGKAALGEPDGKTGTILMMLRRKEGATIAQLTKAVGWESKSVHGVISGKLRAKMGLKVVASKVGGENVYRVA